MKRRFVSIWFRHLLTDWLIRKTPDLKNRALAVTANQKGQPVIVGINEVAERAGISIGMVLADARTLEPNIQNYELNDGLQDELLNILAEFCTRYTPCVSIAAPDGLNLEVTGCTHLWGGEAGYLKEIVIRLRGFGYDARAAMADTVGASWAVSRYGTLKPIIPIGAAKSALGNLPPAALRIEDDKVAKLKRLGLKKIYQLYDIPRSSLAKRFGLHTVLKLEEALGEQEEKLIYKGYIAPYVEDLATPEGVATAEGIEAAITILLQRLCDRLLSDQKGVRNLMFDCFRVDGKVESVEIGTGRPSRNARHLLKLFTSKLDKIEPALGIEHFRLSATQLEDMEQTQNTLLGQSGSFDDSEIKEMVDRLSNRFSTGSIYCYVPQERHWPERSYKAVSFAESIDAAEWQNSLFRPIRLLQRPEPIEVTAPVPDYPPMFFRHNGKLHKVRKADGPERIEAEWWVKNDEARDYFKLEDENGLRYWVYRQGHYQAEHTPNWYLHGYFA